MNQRIIFCALCIAMGIGTAQAQVGKAVGGLVGMGVGSAVGKALASASSDKEVADALEIGAAHVRNLLPMKLDEYTTVDHVFVGPGRQFTYRNTLSFKASDVDMQLFNSELRPQVRTNVCSNQNMVPMRRAGVTVVYVYRGNDGALIGTIPVRPSDCRS